METGEGSNSLLKRKYDLHNAPEVESAARRTKARTGEKVPQDPLIRIQNYLDRFREIIERPNPDKRERGIQAIKSMMLGKFVTKFEEIPDSFWSTQDRLIRERGQSGDWSRYSDEEKLKERKTQVEGVLSDQAASLETWIDYLAGEDSSYMPDYIKYWVFRNVVNLAEYDKEKNEFPNRSKGTVKMFPDINHEALAYVIDAVIKKQKGEAIDFGQHAFDLTDDQKEKFKRYLDNENFAKLYAWANEIIHPIPQHLLPVTDGQWKKYAQGSDHRMLVRSIQGRGTGWCTAGENTAQNQLSAGDFYVFYSMDDYGNPTIPRIAIRMEGDKIAEVRGIAAKQNLDPYMNGVLSAKLEDFSDKDKYLKREKDMRYLTEIDNKVKAGGTLGRDDLIFLYELNSPIEGFGNENLGVSSDPRIKELRNLRNPDEDMVVIFDCTPSQIARKPNEIHSDTKAYVGPLKTGIFDTLRKYKIEHVYTSFPEEKIRLQSLEIGGKNSEQLQAELRAKGFQVSDYAEDLLKSPEFKTLKSTQYIDLVRLTVKDLGFDQWATTDQVYKRAQELGLELCPAEVGPHLRLKDINQPMGEWYYIAMKQITDRDGNPDVFLLERDDDGLWLNSGWTRPGNQWYLENEFVFGLRK